MEKPRKLTVEEVQIYERLKQQLVQLYQDIGTLSKKAPDSPINKFKLGVINEKIATANKLLTNSFLPIEDFHLFDDSDLPSNSDVVLVLSQYLEALELWRTANIIRKESSWYWNTEGKIAIYAGNPDTNYRAKWES
jgi:hypothetical protein